MGHRVDLSCSCLGSGSCALLSHVPGAIRGSYFEGFDATGGGYWLVSCLEAGPEWELNVGLLVPIRHLSFVGERVDPSHLKAN